VSDHVAAAEKLRDLVELPRDERPAAQLSVGNQQRLSLAIALLGEPDVLLLDEPSAALDPPQRHRLWELASGVRARGGAVLFATQNLDELEHFADRVAVLLEGELVFQGTLAEYEISPEARVFSS
jgi:ABC-2 type transport system ATP-binding protein